MVFGTVTVINRRSATPIELIAGVTAKREKPQPALGSHTGRPSLPRYDHLLLGDEAFNTADEDGAVGM